MSMDAVRRLSESEVNAVLRRAAEDTVQDGLTIVQVQEIARDVGLAPEAVQRALAESATGTLQPARLRRTAGIPTGVSKEIVLPAPIGDAAWDVLVSVARATFNAHGKESRTGVVREWRNGRLRIASEPTPNGHRLRLSTEKENALIGPLVIGAAAFFNAVALTTAAANRPGLLVMAAFSALVGVTCLVAPLIRLPRWARTRSEQFDALAREAESLATHPDVPSLPIGPTTPPN
jgi:hypothetical protein